MLAVTSAMARLYPLSHVFVPKLVIISFSFSLLSNMTFSTRDEDNDRSGALAREAPWVKNVVNYPSEKIW